MSQEVYTYKGKAYVKRDQDRTYPAKGDVYLMHTPLSETEVIDVADHDFVYNRHWVLEEVKPVIGDIDGWGEKGPKGFAGHQDVGGLRGWYPTKGTIQDEGEEDDDMMDLIMYMLMYSVESKAIPMPASSEVFKGYGKEWVKTKEKRLPKKGEVYLYDKKPQYCHFNHTPEGSSPVWILQEIPPMLTVDCDEIEIEEIIILVF